MCSYFPGFFRLSVLQGQCNGRLSSVYKDRVRTLQKAPLPLDLLHLHRALNKVTQSANQHMHTFNFLFIKNYLKFLKTLLHVSVIRPSSGSLQFFAKITLINISFDIPILKLAMWQHAATSTVLTLILLTWRIW